MELWQTIAGCGLGVAAGVALGVVCFSAHARYIRKEAIGLRAVLMALLGARPEPVRIGANARTVPVTTRGNATPPPALMRVVPPPLSMTPESSPAPVPPAPVPAFVNQAPLPAQTPAPRSPAQSPPTPAPGPDPLEALFAADRVREFVLGLLSEFDRNRRVARELVGDRLMPMQTDAWDSSQALLRSLPADVRADLEGIYTDIGLLNNLVWLSSEFNRCSPGLRQRYIDLASSVADRLEDLIRRSLSPFSDNKRPFGLPADVLRQGTSAR